MQPISLLVFGFALCSIGVAKKSSTLFNNEIDQNSMLSDIEIKQNCSGHKCGPGRICVIDPGTKEAKCICIPECSKNSDLRRKVCSNYNTTWQSDCHLHKHRCFCEDGLWEHCTEQHKHMHIDYYGECTENIKCEPDVLIDFPRRMREWLYNILTSEHLKKEISNENSQNDIAHKWVDAVIWKYCDLDKEPEDRFVSRHELFPLRAPLLSMEPCISEFLSKCDSNSDHKITLKEWGHCLGAKDGEIQDKCIQFKAIIHQENDFQP